VAIRREESDNYLDNYLVTPISRIRWFSGRLLIIISVVLLAGLLSAVGSWLGLINQHLGVSFSTLLNASINALTPVIFVIGVGIFMFGIRPRLTSFAAYGVLAWAFLIEMLSSGIKINHWILDTSILNHILLAPAVNPNWPKDGFIIIISLVLGLIGLLIFNRRDLQTE
jgi:putative exporter of polyketide antibiotics